LDSYEAFILFHFIEMMKEYLGGYQAAARKLKSVSPYRFLRCLCVISFNEFVLFFVPSPPNLS